MDPTIIGSIIQALATIVVGISAVLITLWQIRLVVRETVRDSYDHFIEERRTILLKSVDDPVTGKWLLKERLQIEGIPDDEINLYVLTLLQIGHYEYVYYRKRKGLFPPELWPQWRHSMAATFQAPMVRKIWQSSFKDSLWPEFKKFVENGFPDK